ncbi:MAG: sulfatase [Dokdonella sp.]
MKRALAPFFAHFVLGLCLAGASIAQATPNLIVLMADDLDLGALERARELGLTPNFDAALQTGGVEFSESFVSNSLCCPSRATFLTGQYTHNHGVLNITFDAKAPQGSFAAFDDSEHIGRWLQRAGYRTGLIGKFLNGYGYVPPRNCPTCDWMTYVPPGWDDWQALPDYGELNGSAGIGYAGAYCMFNYTVNDNGSLVTYGSNASDYQTDVIAQRATDFVDDSATDPRPFFLYLAPLAPHFELCLPAANEYERDVRAAPRHANTLPPSTALDVLKPSFNETDISDKPAWYEGQYPAMTFSDVDALQRGFRHRIEALRALDDMIGSLRTRLQALGHWDNTVLMFTADNGWFNGEHRAWGKVLAYEESIRVPLWMRGPGIPTGATRAALVVNNDLAPTLAALGGATPALPVDGADLTALFGSTTPPNWRRRLLIEHFRDGSWAPVSHADYFAVRTAANESGNAGNRLLVDWRTNDVRNGSEHYALNADPYQVDSIAEFGSEANATLRANLAASLSALKECGRDGRPSCREAEFADEGVFYAGFD